MVHALLRALGRAGLTLLLAITFIILRVAGDPLHSLLPVETPPQVVEMLRQQWGLDRPLHVQFLSYIGHLLHGDFGTSLENGQEALPLVLARVPATLELMGTSLLLALGAGVPLGLLAAHKRGGVVDRLVIALAVFTHSIPNFLGAIPLIQLFAVVLHVLPSGGGDTPAHLVMPVLVIGLANAGIIARFVRSSALEVLGQRYIVAARSRRLGEPAVLTGHVMPNAALPLLTLLGFLVGGMVGGPRLLRPSMPGPGSAGTWSAPSPSATSTSCRPSFF